MANATLEDVYALSKQLSAEDRAKLVERLRLTLPPSEPITRESIVADLERKRAAGLFDNVESLEGRFARPGVDVSEEELFATIREAATEWEKELDEFFGDDDDDEQGDDARNPD